MPKYNVLVTRTSYSTKTIEVEGDYDYNQASIEAIEKASNIEFTEQSAEYEIECIENLSIPKTKDTFTKDELGIIAFNAWLQLPPHQNISRSNMLKIFNEWFEIKIEYVKNI